MDFDGETFSIECHNISCQLIWIKHQLTSPLIAKSLTGFVGFQSCPGVGWRDSIKHNLCKISIDAISGQIIAGVD